MKTVLAFDVYGTLIDTQGVVTQLQTMVDQSAVAFAQTWRDKQLEYSFRRGLMQQYVDFAVCTEQALHYTCAHYQIKLSATQIETLLNSYNTLPAFDDAAAGLRQLPSSQFELYAFSNGQQHTVAALLEAAELAHFFTDVISVDAVQSFKPNPSVYEYFLQQTGKAPNSSNSSNNNNNNPTAPYTAWLISSNPFDVLGALAAGMHSAWLQRSANSLFDPWGIEPTLTINTLESLEPQLHAFQTS